jgi:stress-induced morphogen
MAMAGSEIEAMIREAFPDADVIVTDLAGDGDHFSARVVSQAFAGKSRIQQHQMVYAALKGRMGGELHALALETASRGAVRSDLVTLQLKPTDPEAGA